ncbi:D-amino acid dehydrogenase small subunit [Terasakiispira papahanaumokuakeensis]|uniref:D-amino acid dehydrogenase n=1 Tax=Terasakiispira papahanaumokuakeensis TaxID=197479 RepID=A0A1E2V788_9GAMM|nr:D-amino acid dehydrogenase [Terasakiispira papahanaumokuakeensis]ODC02878.1 D-amino acid dehydrogenase small subunit [Terasakiispira papahanaumokuakeensis]
MKVLVLGSGVVGVTSAWYLAAQGHEVTVVDRQPEAAEETSFGNAGQLSFGMSSPWAAPGIPYKAMKWLFERHAPLKMRLSTNPAQWRFMLSMLRNCNAKDYSVNKSRMVRVSEYSRSSINELRQTLDFNFDERQKGLLQVFRTQKQVADAEKDMAVLREFGVHHKLLSTEECLQVEPALARVKSRIVAGLHFPDDQTGDCNLFTKRLAAQCRSQGVEFRFNTKIHDLLLDGQSVIGARTSAGDLKADQVVLALGSYSSFMVKKLGIRLPIYPIKGYSLTIPVTDDQAAPQSTVMDETYKVAITRLGDRIRAAGTAELANFNDDLPEARRETISLSVSEMFPEGGDLPQAEFWCGFRPMTPDGTPIIGPTAYRNLWLNTGHGTLGWTMSCGSSRLLADLISGRRPEIDPDGLSVARYSGQKVIDPVLKHA